MAVTGEFWLLLCAFGPTLITPSDPHALQFMFALLTDSTVCIIMKILRTSPCEVSREFIHSSVVASMDDME